MHLERHIAMILLASVVAGCSGAEGAATNAGVRQQPASRTESDAMNQSEFMRVAVKAVQTDGGEVAVAQVNGNVAAIVLYRPGDAAASPPTCVLRVVEARDGGLKVVDSNDAIIECPLDTSAEEVRASTILAVGSASVTIERDSAKGHEAFLVERARDGVWYVTKASYTHSEEDPATGDLVVSIDEAAYAPTQNGVALNSYSYAAIEKDLVRKVVE